MSDLSQFAVIEFSVDAIVSKNSCPGYNFIDPGGIPTQGICQHWRLGICRGKKYQLGFQYRCPWNGYEYSDGRYI